MFALLDGTQRLRETSTVADVLDPASQAAGRGLPAYDPRTESLPSRARPSTRGGYRSADHVDATLAPFASDAAAGVPDRLIGSRTGLSAQQVKRWRARRRIRGQRGRRPTELGTRFLLASLLGEHTEPVLHEVSAVQGAWRPPAYTLRRPLKYDLFVRAVHLLQAEMTIEQIALAVGIDERDVAMAALLHAERGAR
jgi:hypothetical protein